MRLSVGHHRHLLVFQLRLGVGQHRHVLVFQLRLSVEVLIFQLPHLYDGLPSCNGAALEQMRSAAEVSVLAYLPSLVAVGAEGDRSRSVVVNRLFASPQWATAYQRPPI